MIDLSLCVCVGTHVDKYVHSYLYVVFGVRGQEHLIFLENKQRGETAPALFSFLFSPALSVKPGVDKSTDRGRKSAAK